MNPSPPPLAGLAPPPEKAPGLLAPFYAGRGNPFERLPAAAYEEPLYRSRALVEKLLIVSDPEAIRRVLVENVAKYPKNAFERGFFTALFGEGLLGSDGPVWRRHRKVMAGAFDPRSVASYGPAMTAAAERQAEAWGRLEDGARIDAAEEMRLLALAVICRTMFSDEGEALTEVAADAMIFSQSALDFDMLDFLPMLGPLRIRTKAKAVRDRFAPLDAAIFRMIERRSADLAAAPRDLLTRLVEAEDSERGAGLTAQEVRDEVITIFMAGHETTAVTLSWAWYVLSQRPEIEARLTAELDAVLGGREASAADLPDLPYLRAFIDEVMRLYPAAPTTSVREALADDVLAGQRVKKGTQILVCPWVVHRHRKLWEDPLAFDPERFLPERAAGRARFAHMPFGAGPRICIGAALAVTEASLALAKLVRRVRLELAPEAEVKLRAVITLFPENGLPMILRRKPSRVGAELALNAA